MTERPASAAPAGRPRNRNLLVWIVVAAFAVQLAVWAVWFTIASRHRVAEVPLAAPAR